MESENEDKSPSCELVFKNGTWIIYEQNIAFPVLKILEA